MIIVLADDFTGAAELAGISLRYGLSAELIVGDVNDYSADVMIISADSRSLKREEAVLRIANISKQVSNKNPSLVFKKIDSVLRGYVVDELKVQMQEMGLNKAFVLPANPSLGRTIVHGEYFVNGVKVNETSFANDPEFPVRSSVIKEILNDEVEVAGQESVLPENGIVVGEASVRADVDTWASKLDNSWLLAGAGDFFTALLEKRFKDANLPAFEMPGSHLYICGTAIEERRKFIRQLYQQQQCVLYLTDEADDRWLKQAAAIIKTKHRLVIAVGETDKTAQELRIKMAIAAKAVIKETGVREIFIEGGSTAAAVLQQLQIEKLQPVNELSRGVVRMKAGELFITVKPGSYVLPDQIKHIYPFNGDKDSHRLKNFD